MGSLATSNHIIQGEYRVSNDPDVALTTLLGSCVAACIWDPVLHVGGMNHFLLPGDNEQQIRDSERYGVHLMELLVNALFRQGASRQRLVAKLFGGANLNTQLFTPCLSKSLPPIAMTLVSISHTFIDCIHEVLLELYISNGEPTEYL